MERRRYAGLLAAAMVLVLGGCSGESEAPRPLGDLNVVRVGALGDVTDAHGLTLYRFDQDKPRPSVSRCYDVCAALWPPVLATAGTITIEGLDQNLIGSTTRHDGNRQLTLAGWPLYRHARDTATGETTGDGANGTWFAVTPRGTKASSDLEAGPPGR